MEAGPDTSIDVEDLADSQAENARWRSLFNFTKTTHITTLIVATVLSMLSGFIAPAVAIFAGKLFAAFAEYGGGRTDGHELVSRVSTQCIALVALGGASWVLNGGYFMFWLVFGELQAKNAREKLFGGLMERDMAWYDMRKDGVGALIPRLQRSVWHGPFCRLSELTDDPARFGNSRYRRRNPLAFSSSTR